ncbi:MAG: rhomboid family protein [Acidiferrobacter sp.]
MLSKFERRFGRYAISNLMAYIVGAQGVVFLLSRTANGHNILSELFFSQTLIAQGQIWRVISFILIPPSFSIWVFFILYFYYLLGARLEEEWGNFRFNVYYFTGVTFSILGAFLAGASATATYLNLSIFLAFATIDPEFSILLFFVIPVKVRYLAWLAWLWVAYTVALGPVPAKIMAVVSLLNYFMFFWRDLKARLRGGAFRRARRSFLQSAPATSAPIHRCTICGATERDEPRVEFRYCSKCAGHHEYCLTHLAAHEHIR